MGVDPEAIASRPGALRVRDADPGGPRVPGFRSRGFRRPARRPRLTAADFCATGLPIIVAVTTVAVKPRGACQEDSPRGRGGPAHRALPAGPRPGPAPPRRPRGGLSRSVPSALAAGPPPARRPRNRRDWSRRLGRGTTGRRTTARRRHLTAEDRGFEPLRAVNPTRFPSERHRPLGESSAEEATGAAPSGEIRRSPRCVPHAALGRCLGHMTHARLRRRTAVDWSAESRSPRLRANPPCGGIMPNSPRAGRQQG